MTIGAGDEDGMEEANRGPEFLERDTEIVGVKSNQGFVQTGAAPNAAESDAVIDVLQTLNDGGGRKVFVSETNLLEPGTSEIQVVDLLSHVAKCGGL